jgi:hypothetical protein
MVLGLVPPGIAAFLLPGVLAGVSGALAVVMAGLAAIAIVRLKIAYLTRPRRTSFGVNSVEPPRTRTRSAPCSSAAKTAAAGNSRCPPSTRQPTCDPSFHDNW